MSCTYRLVMIVHIHHRLLQTVDGFSYRCCPAGCVIERTEPIQPIYRTLLHSKRRRLRSEDSRSLAHLLGVFSLCEASISKSVISQGNHWEHLEFSVPDVLPKEGKVPKCSSKGYSSCNGSGPTCKGFRLQNPFHVDPT